MVRTSPSHKIKEEDVHSFVTVMSGWLPFAVSECAYYVGHPCLATRSTWCILRLKMARDGCAAGLMPFGWCQLVEPASWSGSQTHCFEYKATNLRILHSTKYCFLFFGWLALSAYKGVWMTCDSDFIYGLWHLSPPHPHALCLIRTFFHDCQRHPRLRHSPEWLLTTQDSKELHLCPILGGAAPPISDSSTPRREYWWTKKYCNQHQRTTQKGRRTLNPGCGGVVGG